MTYPVLIVLTTLVAEGTPILALDLCRRWPALGLAPRVLTLFDGPNDLRAELESLGVIVESLALARQPGRGLLRYADMARGVARTVRASGAHAVLSMPFGWHTFIAAGARAGGAARVLAHIGNAPPEANDLAFSKFFALVQLGRTVTDRLVCCSNYVRAGVTQRFRLPDRETTVIPNGCRIDDIASRAHLARMARPSMITRPRIGMVARLERHKDQPTLLRAARLLVNRGVDVELELIGEGSRRGEYERLISELGLEQVARLPGTRRDIPEALGGLDVFAFAAKRDEGQGIALVEAMAAGVPVVATNVGACREVLEGGSLGVLVEPGDPQAMADGIEQTLRNRELAAARALEAHKHARTVFDVEAMANRYARELRGQA